MEIGESNSIPQPDREPAKQVKQEAYPVKLRTHLLKHITERLTPSFDTEKLAIQQRDGSYQEMMDFITHSPFGDLMQRLGMHHDDVNNMPYDKVVQLSKEDMNLIKDKITSPSINDYVGLRVHKEMMEELETKFSGARTTAQIKNALKRVRGFVKEK